MPFWLPDNTWPATQARPGKRRSRLWVPPSATVPDPQFLLDNFTGSDGSLLNAHTSDSGASWAIWRASATLVQPFRATGYGVMPIICKSPR